MASPASLGDKKGEKPQQVASNESDDELLNVDEIRPVPETNNGTTTSGKTNPDDDFIKNEGNLLNIPLRPIGDGRSKDNGVDDFDGARIPPIAPSFPGTFVGTELPDMNFYQQKQTLAKGMMDLALFSANANQLRYVLECADRHPYFYPSMLLISFSLICQVGVGIALLWNAMYNIKHEMRQAARANNCTVIAIFLVTVINVFVSAFGVANPPPVT